MRIPDLTQPILNVSDDPLLRRFFTIAAIVFTLFGLTTTTLHGLADPPRLFRAITGITLATSGVLALLLLRAERPLAAFKAMLWGAG